MSLVIRLSKAGKRGQRQYKIVVKEKRSKRDGAAIEFLGWFEKTEKTSRQSLDKKRYEYWVSQGATPSLTVKSIAEAAK